MDDRPNRPHSRDSTLSKESRGSKEGKGSRSSRDREIGFGMKKEEKIGKLEKEKSDHELEIKKGNKGGKQQQQQPQDLRGFFQGGALGESEKKGVRQAPGPITRERLEQVDAQDRQGMTTLTQLKKGGPGSKQEEKADNHVNNEVEKAEVSGVTLSLIDPDLLENISDEEENFDASEADKNLEAATVGARGGRGSSRGGGRGGRGDGGKFAARGKNESRGERGAGGGRGGRGGRGEGKSRGGGAAPNRWNETQQPQQPEEEDNGLNKGFGQPAVGSQWGFLPRGQPSRRGRGAGGRQDGRGGGATRVKGFEDGGAEEIGEWGDDEMEKKSGGGRTKVGGRSKAKKEGPRPGSGGGEEGEEWETASETSLEEREKRSKATTSAPSRGGRANGGRGGRGQGTGGFWEGKGRRGGAVAGGSAPGGQEVKEGTPEPKRVGPSIDSAFCQKHRKNQQISSEQPAKYS